MSEVEDRLADLQRHGFGELTVHMKEGQMIELRVTKTFRKTLSR